MNESLREELKAEMRKELRQELRQELQKEILKDLKDNSRGVGRPSGLVIYRHVLYNGKEYTVGTVEYKKKDIHFVFDKEDFTKVNNCSWHFQTGKYIGHTEYVEEVEGGPKIKKELYLHNLVMNRLDNPGQGAAETVDHINRNGLDNRKENLRILSQTEQNMNQKKKVRNVVLPENCGIEPNSIPKHIWYVRANGHHGDRFAIEFKTEGLVWRGSSSKKIPLTEKLAAAIEQLEVFYTEYPRLNPAFEEDKRNQLTESFNAILSLNDGTVAF